MHYSTKVGWMDQVEGVSKKRGKGGGEGEI